MSNSVPGYRKQEGATIPTFQGKIARITLILQLFKKHSLNAWQITSPRYKERQYL